MQVSSKCLPSVDLRTAHYNSRNLPACVGLCPIKWITSGKSEANTWTTIRTVPPRVLIRASRPESNCLKLMVWRETGQ